MKRSTIPAAVIAVLVLCGCQKVNTASQNTAPSGSTGTAATGAPGEASAAPAVSAASTSAPAAPSAPSLVEIPARTVLRARVDEALSTARNRAGDRFQATLETPVNVGGREVLPSGTRLTGHVTTSRPSGRLKGRATLGITLDSVDYHGRAVPVTTSLDTKTSEAHKKRNLELIGGGGGLGALIGAIAGGGKGAAIGAGAGAAAGAGGAYATGKKEVEVPAETVFTFRLKAPVGIPE